MMGQSGANTTRISDWMLGSLRKNPEGLLLLAAGAVLLMRKNSSAAAPAFQSSDYQSAAQSSSSDSGFAQQAKDAASSVAASAADYAGQAGQAIGSHSERIAKNARSTVQTSMTRILEEQPLMVAVAGLAAGGGIPRNGAGTANTRAGWGSAL
jgi:hypothetical protein